MTLIPHGVKELTRTGAVDANGDEHDLDIIVLATGFDAANYLGNYRVLRAGRRRTAQQVAAASRKRFSA